MTSSLTLPARITALLLVGINTLSLPALAVDSGDKSSYNKKRFGGWQSIAFNCSSRPENPTTSNLCAWSELKIRGLSKLMGIPIVVTKGHIQEQAMQKFNSEVPKPLTFRLYLFSTGTDPLAMHMSLKAEETYSGAVETVRPTDQEKVPRPGTLVLWEMESIASGPRGSEFEEAVRNSLDSMLTKLVSDFSDAL